MLFTTANTIKAIIIHDKMHYKEKNVKENLSKLINRKTIYSYRQNYDST